MRRFILSIVFLAFAASSVDAGMVIKRRAVEAAPPGGASFSDDFSGTLAKWTQDGAVVSIDTGSALLTAGSWAYHAEIYTDEACSTVNQYVKLKLVTGGTGYPTVIFRYTNSSSEFYAIQIGETAWMHRSSVSGSDTQIASDAFNPSSGDVVGITITGTGADTEVRIWQNPTGDAPTAANDWGGDTTPTVTWTTDPGANAVDTGNYVGFGGSNADANSMRIDDFFGGDIP